MDILIKKREMTKGCNGCPCQNYNLIMEVPFCNLTYTTLRDDRAEQKPSWCPLVEVPPHGRLIDADELLASDAIDWGEEAWNGIHNAPTVLERT